ncbi:hypothetical protein Tco_1379461 [Tanacetum coccineum]
MPFYSDFTILHSESTLGHDASADSTTKADPGKSAPNDSISQQQGASYIEKEIEYAKEEFNTSPDLSSSDDKKKEIKMEDLSKLVLNMDVDFMDLDSPEDDQTVIVKDEEEEEVHAEKDDAEKEPKETEDASASHPLSLRSIQIQELTNQVLLLQSQNSKSKKKKIKFEAKGELIKKDKGKKAMSSKDAKEEGTKSETNEANLNGPMGESSKEKKMKKFDFLLKEVITSI